MQKLLLSSFIIFCLQIATAKAQWVTIPDTNFVAKLTQLYPSCMNGNQMDITCSQIVNETSLDLYSSNITNLTGITYFVNLTSLNCGNNQITSITALPASLITFYCHYNQLTNLPALPNNLQNLGCAHNAILSLPVLPNNLQYLDCGYNQLTNLPILPFSLLDLYCEANQLATLPTLPSTLLFLGCWSNQLTSLPSLPSFLTEIRCYGNQLSSLPSLPNSLQILSSSSNQLTSLPAIPNSLLELGCSNNLLTILPPMPFLDILWCKNNQLTSLPPSLMVSRLDCGSNLLTSLPPLPDVMYTFKIDNNNIHCLNELPNISSSFNADISNNPLTCVPNQTNYSLGLPLCLDNDTANNPNNCPSLINISGHVFTDQNNNCSYNANDIGSSNIPVKLYDSLNTLIAQNYSANGAYGFSLNQPGIYKVKILNNNLPISFACAQPDSQTVNLIASSIGISNIDFPVTCNTDTTYDIRVQCINRQGLAFPGQLHTLKTNIISNENWYNLVCDTIIYSGTVNITINGLVQYNSPAPGALIPQVSGNTFTYSISDFNSLTPASFGLKFLTDTTAQAGDQICVHVEINPTPLDADTTNNVYDFCYQVVNSYDPNMKEVYPVNVLPGYDDWFTYTIHFQNTGNAPAFNIRLRDTLDANLDINSFEVRGYSHPAQISINGNVLTVRFNNIMLPDSTTDYEGSMGYFQYRLKPLPNLPNGTQIENTAYIYFDYNAPIVTNTTQNNFDITVKTNDIKLEEEHYILYPNPSTGLFMFNPDRYRDNKNIKTVEVFNMMGELVLSQGNAKQINLQGFPKGIYVARINGSQVCRLVKE